MANKIKEPLEKPAKQNKKNAALQHLLDEAKSSINEIKPGGIDALIAASAKDIKAYTETIADKTYRILIEEMHEGAVTLNTKGNILYCNSYFAGMLNLPLQKVIGAKFKTFISDSSKERFDALIAQAKKNSINDEFYIYAKDGKAIPVLMCLNTLTLDNNFISSIILTDLTNRNKTLEELKRRTGQLEQKNLELERANEELAFQSELKEKRAAELIIANEELAFQNDEKEKRAAELGIANEELAFQNDEKEKRAAELGIANKELAIQNDEKEKRAAELSIANKELAFQNDEKEKRAAELIIANEELAFQNDEKEKRAAELSIANEELAFQNDEKEKRAAELSIANKELAFQNDEKEKRAAELSIANKELAFQSELKEKRAAELSIANEELAFQNHEKEKRAAELSIANKELAFQSELKEKRAAELSIANQELAFQNDEKEKRAAELSIANKELAFQNDEKEKRAAELSTANKDLTSFTYVSSHDLQEPLRKIKNFISVLVAEEKDNLSDDGKNYLQLTYETAKGMQALIEALLTYSRTKGADRKFEKTDLAIILDGIKKDFKEILDERKATIEAVLPGEANVIPFQFRQLLLNLISNSLKFSNIQTPLSIVIKSEIVHGDKFKNASLLSKLDYYHIIYTDNGIGFDQQYADRIFEVFQRLHSKEEYEGTGMGLAICKRIVENHNGIITATGKLDKGARFDIFIPAT